MFVGNIPEIAVSGSGELSCMMKRSLKALLILLPVFVSELAGFDMGEAGAIVFHICHRIVTSLNDSLSMLGNSCLPLEVSIRLLLHLRCRSFRRGTTFSGDVASSVSTILLIKPTLLHFEHLPAQIDDLASEGGKLFEA